MANRDDIDPADVLNRYKGGESASSLARAYGCSVWAIISRLRRNGVRVRSPKEQNEKRLNMDAGTTERFVQFIDGLLLGDGSINFKNCFYLTQTMKREQWVFYVRGLFAEMGALTRMIPRGRRQHILEGRRIEEKPHWVLYSPAYVEMALQRERWYDDGEKRVPHDVRLTPLAVAHWFAGDGSSSGPTLFFCTNGFRREDVEHLAEQMGVQMGIEARPSKTKRSGQYRLTVGKKREAFRLATLIRPHLAHCCMYKLRGVRRRL